MIQRGRFSKALLCNATCIILPHNHPFRDVTSSETDVVTHGRVKQVSEIMEVPLKDNLIIGNNCWFSFAESGIL